MPPSLAIGDFARATHLSVKTLRHYHGVGLLVPAEVDPGSGYRRYTLEQIPAAQVIRRFRALDMPLEKIAEVLGAPDLRARNDLIAAHLARMEEGLAQTHAAVASLRDLLQGPPAALLIEHRSEEAIQSAAICEVVDLDDLGLWFEGAIGELHATLAFQDVPISGPPGAVIANDFFSDERGEVTIFLPVAVPVRSVGRVTSANLPAVELATTVHAGSHADVDRTYGSLATYVSEHALGVDGPIRERYLVGRRDTRDEAKWRTEIGWPIFDTSTPA
jgi:DNA-binding transcriptional MerR regulator/effector-binding domain-containing protein